MLVKRGLIAPSDMSLFKVTTSVDEAVAEIINFYRVYHSMRYVGNDLVLRLQKRLTEPVLAAIQDEFADILQSGRFEQTTALPEEIGDARLHDLPRLKFCFDRQKLGLRLLVDRINREG